MLLKRIILVGLALFPLPTFLFVNANDISNQGNSTVINEYEIPVNGHYKENLGFLPGDSQIHYNFTREDNSSNVTAILYIMLKNEYKNYLNNQTELFFNPLKRVLSTANTSITEIFIITSATDYFIVITQEGSGPSFQVSFTYWIEIPSLLTRYGAFIVVIILGYYAVFYVSYHKITKYFRDRKRLQKLRDRNLQEEIDYQQNKRK